MTKEDAQRATTAPKAAPLRLLPGDACGSGCEFATAPAKAAPSHMPPQVAKVAYTGERVERREKMSQLRQKVAERLVSVRQTTAMLTTFNEIDMSNLIQIRKDYKEKFEQQHGVRLGFMSFFVEGRDRSAKVFPGGECVD